MKLQFITIIRRLLITSCISFCATALLAQGTFAPTGSLQQARTSAQGILLNDGRALIWASYGGPASFELYNPVTGLFTLTGSLSGVRNWPGVTRLNDGRVFVGGGSGWRSVEIYDPSTGTFSYGGELAAEHYLCNYSTVTLLDGRVLICGGFASGWSGVGTADLYDPVTKTSRAIAMHHQRASCCAVRLNNGKVLVMGGDNGSAPGATMELFDPATETFSEAGTMSSGRMSFGAVLLPDGRVFICEGTNVRGNVSATASCDIYDPVTGTITQTYQASLARNYIDLALLPDGRVLITSQTTGGGDEIFDPSTGTFTQITGRTASCWECAANVVLNDGRVLLLGSASPTCQVFISNLAPTANAGPDQILQVGTASQATITMDGSGSNDPEGHALTYTWSGAFGTASGVSPSITLPLGIHEITLTVADEFNQKSTALLHVAIASGVGSAEFGNLQTQLTAANDQIATLTVQNNTLLVANQTLTQKNASLLSLLQSLLQKFEQIQSLSTSIGGLSQDGKQAINQAVGN
jgi:WD40 repeat protein